MDNEVDEEQPSWRGKLFNHFMNAIKYLLLLFRWVPNYFSGDPETKTKPPNPSIPHRPTDTSSDHSFQFAFNNIDFSDRTIRLEITEIGSPSDVEEVRQSRWWWWRPKQEEKRLRAVTLHVNSAILAAKSPFFYNLFSNNKYSATVLLVDPSEEAAVMELLNFAYAGHLSRETAESPSAVLDVLMAADKFDVVSCIRHCSVLLRDSSPMTEESASTYLGLPHSVLAREEVRPLIDAAKEVVSARFKGVTDLRSEMAKLPLLLVEALLWRDDLSIASEDEVYDAIIEWAREKYPEREERRRILGSNLARLVRMPHMSWEKLREIVKCGDNIDKELVLEAVIDALFFKAAPNSHMQRSLVNAASDRFYVARSYRHRPVKVVELERPRPHCIVYLDLKREELARLELSESVRSQLFWFRAHAFHLSLGHFDTARDKNVFAVFLCMPKGDGAVGGKWRSESTVRMTCGGEFGNKETVECEFEEGKKVMFSKIFMVGWAYFKANHSPYFVDRAFHLRVELGLLK
ncbi:BTB/POZ domain-containing protein POB1 [Acorus gramineus]|uniref:BTB/POZ domain-containing protein POB1 n=1 Tax=Acorus gramineus TaxID=55184 RepID=A0AAV9BXZ7_ACOGR|nr:BTB/POZ domain-containing protein POB1 [Acorus gramineus]